MNSYCIADFAKQYIAWRTYVKLKVTKTADICP